METTRDTTTQKTPKATISVTSTLRRESVSVPESLDGTDPPLPEQEELLRVQPRESVVAIPSDDGEYLGSDGAGGDFRLWWL